MDDVFVREVWAPVPGYVGIYEVSDKGRVRSRDRYINRVRLGKRQRFPLKGKVFSPSVKQDGYREVKLTRAPGRAESRRVHQLVAEAFIGPRPDGMEVCHNNGNPSDNRLENLRYGTPSENMKDRVLHGRDPRASMTACIRGHEFTPENTIIRRDGRRRCRTCHLANTKSRPRVPATEAVNASRREKQRAWTREERDAFNAYARERWAARRAVETPGERELRLAKQRAYDRAYRAKRRATREAR